jgi:acetyl esterase/lipase
VYPLVVLIHGGGLCSGDPGEMIDLANLLSAKGFATASINYRLSGDALSPAGAQDVAAGVRYLRARSASKTTLWATPGCRARCRQW